MEVNGGNVVLFGLYNCCHHLIIMTLKETHCAALISLRQIKKSADCQFMLSLNCSSRELEIGGQKHNKSFRKFKRHASWDILCQTVQWTR